ncbi:MAG TPA: c-type cytochrome [Pyrinomonadaceae bacterium]|nr:c-type cytochrome [Pyrinomonadaceae bacterium]
MAETPKTDTDALALRKEPEATAAPQPARDPIISRSTSNILLVCALLLMASLAWALYDEAYGQRPWKSMQQEFVSRYNRYLRRLKRTGTQSEKEVKESDAYKQLDLAVREAEQAAAPRKKEINDEVKFIDRQLAAITDPFQNKRGYITVVNYRIETSDESDRKDLREEIEEQKSERVEVEMPVDPHSDKTEAQKLNYTELEQKYLALKDRKAALLTESAAVSKEADELKKNRETYLKDNVIGVSAEQIDRLITENNRFDYSIRQINVNGDQLVDRCETCHLGIREPLELKPVNFKRPGKKIDASARAFVSHPSKELLQIHNPERFGCSSCHGGNGRATTSVVKGHGRHRFWLHPLYERENMEAGCQQCHAQDRVLQGANVLTKGKDLFQERGCVGCHRYEGFDRETDGLANSRQTIKQLEEQLAMNDREARQLDAEAGTVADEAEAQRKLARAVSLRVTNSQIEARIEQLNVQARYLMQDQKKVGPNLKDVRLKLRKEWIPAWLKDPQGFRPGTKMPTFWYLNPDHELSKNFKQNADNERAAISAYLWQSSFEGQVPKQEPGDATHGKELFETKGCMACHAIGEGVENQVGGTFAANLTRVGEKADFNYIVRWIYNPRERWAPYCPKEKRDLTRADYERNGKPYRFDTEGHSKCPNDGAELQVQNMTVMPNFRLSEQDSRDIATYLFSLSKGTQWPDASYMDDPKLKDQGAYYIKQYGCANCHEIRGFEDEQRIGKELTAEGATPIERLDFALLTHDAEKNINPFTGQKYPRKEGVEEKWYNRKGFFEHKLEEPGIYDKGKEKEPRDRLRMPDPYLTPEWKNALTTFLLGSVGAEGANVPASYFYQPNDRGKDIQEGWWVIKKYNCMGCHSIQVGQKSVLQDLPQYLTPEGKDQLPPALMTEGARVDPNWLLRFLTDPSLSNGTDDPTVRGLTGRNNGGARANSSGGTNSGGGGQASGGAATGNQPPSGATSNQAQGGASSNQPQANSGGAASPGAASSAQSAVTRPNNDSQDLPPQPGANKNGVRLYLKARMPTFNFSPNELRTLVRFFLAVSSQPETFIKEPTAPLTDEERNLARQLFTSQQAPCLKCHLTGNPTHDKNASAPNFLQAGERLQPGWTFRWLLDPQKVMPGTAMPSELFKRDGERWVFNGELPASFNEYKGDHADLLVRYMLQLTPAEQARLASGSPSATGGTTTTGETTNATTQSSTHHAPRGKATARKSKYKQRAAVSRARRVDKRAAVGRRRDMMRASVRQRRDDIRMGRDVIVFARR